MDESKRYEISVLATDAHEKRERFNILGMANRPSDPDKRREQSVVYELALADMIEADAKLRIAQHSITQ